MKKTTGIPVMFLAGLLPLACYFHIESIEFSQYPWFPNQGYWLDWFLFGKSQLLQILALLMAAILLIYRIRERKRSFEPESIGLVCMGILFVVSAFLSAYPKESLQGTIEQYEPVGVLLSYLVIGGFCFRYAQKEENTKWIAGALLIGLLLSCIVGFFQFFQMDLWSTEFGKRLLIPETYAQMREGLRFGEDANGFRRVYMGLYNSSYASIYLVMLMPFLLLLPLKLAKITAIPVMLCLLGTFSKTAWLSAAIISVLGIWIFKKPQGKQKKRYMLLGITAILVCGVLALVPMQNEVLKENKLQEVTGEEAYIRIVYQGNPLYFSEYPKDDGVTYRIVDENGEEIELFWAEERGEMDALDSRFQGLHFKVYLKENISYAVFRYEDVVFRFTDDLGTGRYEYISINGKPDELEPAKTAKIFPDSFLNGRGYIWNRTIPIIGENLLFGTGPDTSLQVFPQDDYVARANLGYGFFSEILTNAHSLYLQMLLQTGLLSLVFFLLISGRYLMKAWNYYSKKSSDTLQDKIGICCFLGCVAYLLCGITFSSSVCTMPFFMMLLGTGMGIIKNNCKQKN